MPVRKKVLRCSFCGRADDEVSKLLAGPKAHICGDCVTRCNDILGADGTPPFTQLNTLSNEEILSSLKSIGATAESLYGVLHERVDELRLRNVSWAAIGAALDISRQAVWERFS